MSNSVNLRKIAEEAGVSISTVSRALRHHPNVSAELRRRVQAALDRLEYRPNPLVSALMEHIRRSRSPVFQGKVGFLCWCPTREMFTELTVLRRFFDGAVRGANAQGFGIEVFLPVADNLSRKLLMRMIRSRGILGLVAIVHAAQDPLSLEVLSPLPELSSIPVDVERISVAALGGKFEPRSPNFAKTDQYAAGLLAAHETLRLGYRKPLLVISSYLDAVTEHRVQAGFREVWERGRSPGSLRTLIIREGDHAALIEAVRQTRPDMVFGHTREFASALRRAGLRIPEDLGFASMDVAADDDVAGIDQLHEEVGSAAISLLIGQIQRGERGLPSVTKGVLIEGRWRDGSTLPSRL